MGGRVLVDGACAALTPIGVSQRSSDWSGWIHVGAIQALFHHTTAVIAALIVSALVGFVVQRILHDGPIRRAILFLDELLVLCLFLYFAYELLTSL